MESARVLRTWELRGGITAQMTAAEVELPDGTRSRLVVRRLPGIADEYRLLTTLRGLGLPVPNPRHLDSEYLVLDYVEGAPAWEASAGVDTAGAMARQLAAIHAIDGDRPEFAALPRRVDQVAGHLNRVPDAFDSALRHEVMLDVLAAHWPPPPPARVALLHGDFWPGNVLWRDREIEAVIDWEEACVGDPLADVAITRLDMLWAYGPGAMSVFTDHYFATTGVDATLLPLWDVVAASRPVGQISVWASDWPACGRPDVTPQTMRDAHQWFLSEALARLT